MYVLGRFGHGIAAHSEPLAVHTGYVVLPSAGYRILVFNPPFYGAYTTEDPECKPLCPPWLLHMSLAVFSST